MGRLVFIVLFVVVSCFNAYSQKIKESYVDDFTGNKIIKTSWVNIMSWKNTSNISFERNGSDFVVCYKAWVNSSVMEGDRLLVKMDNDSIAAFRSVGIYTPSMGGASTGLGGSRSIGVSARFVPESESDQRLISNNMVLKIRLHTSGGYNDIDVSDASSNAIREAVYILQDEYEHFDEIHLNDKKRR